MGYWEEKQQYQKDIEEKERRNKFCNICGRKLIEKNVKGKCEECGAIICNFCGKIQKGKIVCIDCQKDIRGEQSENRNFTFKGKPLGIIPLWVVLIGFFAYIIPGVIILIARQIQLLYRTEYAYRCGNCRETFYLGKHEINSLKQRGL